MIMSEYLTGLLAALALLALLFDLFFFAACLELSARALDDAQARVSAAQRSAAFWRQRWTDEVG